MMTMALCGLGASVGTAGMGLSGVTSASKEGDEAEMQAMNEQEQALAKSSETSLSDVKLATSPETATKESIATAQRSINELKISSKHLASKGTISKEQEASINAQAEASQKALDHAQYQPGGTKAFTEHSTEHDAYQTKLRKENLPENTKPQEAVKHYRKQATNLHNTRTGSNLSSSTAKPGATPDLPATSQLSATPTNTDRDVGIDSNQVRPDPSESPVDSTPSQSANGTNPSPQENQTINSDSNLTKQKINQQGVTNYKNSANKTTINRNSEAWQRAYSNRSSITQLYSGVGMAISQTFGSAGQMMDQTYQAKGTQDSAAAQVQAATEQATEQGVSSTSSLASSLRDSMNAVAQDMSSMVSATRV